MNSTRCSMLRTGLLAAFALLVMLSFRPLAAAPQATGGAPAVEAADDDDWDDGGDDFDSLFSVPVGDAGGWEEEARTRTYPWIEHQGSFRFRSGLFWRAHLGTDRIIDGASTIGSSGMMPPLTHNAENNQAGAGVFDPDKVGRGRDDETIAGANIRFRYSPTIHIGSGLRIHSQVDLLDNLVLGSTPDFSGTAYGFRPDVPLAVLGSGGQVPPASGTNSFQDSIRVKQAYGEWEMLGVLRFGRMASHWGLGIFQNSGQHPNASFGDFHDRVSWTGTLWGVHVMAAWDFAYEGPTSASPGHFYGQAYDLDQADDVNQWVLAIFQKPLDERSRAIRKADLEERRVPVLDWGFYNLVRIQDLDLSYESSRMDMSAPDAWDRLQFVQRNAWVWIPDIWLRLEWRPAFGRRLRLEMESLLAVGRFNAVVREPGDMDAGLERYEILQYGGVLKGDYQMGGLSFGMELGVASGDSTPGLGVLHPGNLYAEDGTLVPRANRRITNFMFDRDYHVDLLLFREVLGTVTNALYVKPFVEYDLFEGENDGLGARLEVIYARALEPGATPGKSANYGLELDLKIFFEDRGRFLATLEWGILFPFGALDLANGYMGYTGSRVKSRWATTLQARVHWMF